MVFKMSIAPLQPPKNTYFNNISSRDCQCNSQFSSFYTPFTQIKLKKGEIQSQVLPTYVESLENFLDIQNFPFHFFYICRPGADVYK